MSRITALILAALAFFTSILGFGAAKKRQGVKQERSEAQKKDQDNANEIRNDVESNLDDRVRKFDGAGYRD